MSCQLTLTFNLLVFFFCILFYFVNIENMFFSFFVDHLFLVARNRLLKNETKWSIHFSPDYSFISVEVLALGGPQIIMGFIWNFNGLDIWLYFTRYEISYPVCDLSNLYEPNGNQRDRLKLFLKFVVSFNYNHCLCSLKPSKNVLLKPPKRYVLLFYIFFDFIYLQSFNLTRIFIYIEIYLNI